MESDKDILKKQEYLKGEIIDKNYDKDAFLDFCIRKKNDGDDLNNWSMDELKQIVEEFINKQKAAEGREKTRADNMNETNTKIETDIEKIDLVKSENEEKYLEKEIMCRRQTKSPLNDIKITVRVTQPKINEGSFFTSSYITYEVITDELSYSVRRRYSDFEWLRNSLSKLYPGYFIPPLPSKKFSGRRFEEDFIEKRMKFLNKFLRIICENEIFKSSESLVSFLQIIDRNTFESKMKEISLQQTPLLVEEMRTLNGKLLLIDDEGNEKYYKNTLHFFNFQVDILERLKTNLRNLKENMFNLSDNLRLVANDFKKLEMLNARVLMKEEIVNSFSEFKTFFKDFADVIDDQNYHIKHDIKDFFKYIRMENLTFLELAKTREEWKQKYNSELLKLNLKKEKLWTQMDFSKWELSPDFELSGQSKHMLQKDKNYAFKNMLHKETQAVVNLHNKVGYLNKLNMDELRFLISSHLERFSANNKKFSEDFYPTLTKGIGVWSNFTTNLIAY
jgi:hypothetical protein